MQTSSKPNIVFRILAAGILGMFAFAPLYVGGAVLWRIIQEPLGTPPEALVALGICAPLSYFLLLLSWRALSWHSARPDGGLLPPLVMQVFVVLFGAVVAFGVVGNFVHDNYVRTGLGIFVLSGVVVVFRQQWRRHLANKALKSDAPKDGARLS
jgi:apolipoprotein N-acyltransferase